MTFHRICEILLCISCRFLSISCRFLSKSFCEFYPDYILHIAALFKGYSTLGVHYQDLQARVHEQETRNLTLHEAQPSAVLNFEFLVRERVLVNPIMHEQRVLKTF